MSGVFIPLSSHTKDYSGMIFAFLADMSGFMFCLLHYDEKVCEKQTVVSFTEQFCQQIAVPRGMVQQSSDVFFMRIVKVR